MPEFAPVLNVSALNGANGFRLDGDAALDYSGRRTSGAGDVNGDGFADLIIGAPFSDTGGADRGLAWVVFGGATAPAAQGLAARVAAGTAYRFQGEGAGDQFAYGVSSAGDVNGDGFDDLLIGAEYADPDVAGANRGASYLVFGGAAKLEALDAADGLSDNLCSLALLAPATGYRLDGVADGDHAGASVSAAGDINNDGIADFIIGAPAADPLSGGLNINEGASYIVFGGSNLGVLDNDDGSQDARIDLAQISAGQGLRLNGQTGAFGMQSGWSVSAAGDVNGDGYDDAIVGAPQAATNVAANIEGAAYLVFGRPQSGFTFDALNFSSIDGVNVARLDGVASGDRAGHAVSGLGDVNGDGFDDVAIGAPKADLPGSESGGAYVVFGRSAWAASSDLADLTGGNGFRLTGLRDLDYTGWCVSAAGDVNGDGFDDILVSAMYSDRLGALDSGALYVVFGKASGFAAAIDLGALDGNDGFRIEGAASPDNLGVGVLGAAGDVNGDGFDDILVGAPRATNGPAANGATYVIYGHRAETAVTRVGTALSNVINAGMGDDTLFGLSGNDKLFGWENDDVLDGGDGTDVVSGGDGEDIVKGGGGDDSLRGNAGADALYGGSGSDFASYYDDAGLTVSLANALLNTGAAAGDTFVSVENISGSNLAADTLIGNAAANKLYGNAGADILQGMDGADTLRGNAGIDTLSGGAGADTFQYLSSSEGGDIITAFSSIDFFSFKGSAFGSLPAGTLAANRFVSRATDNLAQTTTQRFIYEEDSDRLWYDSNGSTGGAANAVLIADITGNAVVAAADILIF